MTATESDAHTEPTGGGDATVHYAVHSPGEGDEADPKVRQRARARESTPQSAQSQPVGAPAVDLDKHPEAVTWSDRIEGAKDLFSPPDIWSNDRPSLKQVWEYATRGDWTGSDGVPRRVGQIYALTVAVPVVAVTYGIAWTAERGSRLAAVIVLLVLLAQVPPLTWLI